MHACTRLGPTDSTPPTEVRMSKGPSPLVERPCSGSLLTVVSNDGCSSAAACQDIIAALRIADHGAADV